MNALQIYDRVVNWPGVDVLTGMFAASIALIVLAALLLSMGKKRVFARALGILGLILILLAMFVIHEQVDREKVGPYITISRPRFSEATRFQVRVAILGVPAAAAFVMTTVLAQTRRRLRSSVPRHLKEGRRQMVLGDLDKALTECNHALEISPYLGEAYFDRGRVFEARGQIDEALADYDHALKCDPQLGLAYLHRANLRTTKGELEGALSDYDQVMIMRPNDVECYLNRGICLSKKGKLEDAAVDFRRVLKLTNHSDFADPARQYLEQLHAAMPPGIDPPGSNGVALTDHTRREAVGRDPGS